MFVIWGPILLVTALSLVVIMRWLGKKESQAIDEENYYSWHGKCTGWVLVIGLIMIVVSTMGAMALTLPSVPTTIECKADPKCHDKRTVKICRCIDIPWWKYMPGMTELCECKKEE